MPELVKSATGIDLITLLSGAVGGAAVAGKIAAPASGADKDELVAAK